MSYQDPLFAYTLHSSLAAGGRNVLNQIRGEAVAAGWTIDRWLNTNPVDERGGAELCMHTNCSGLSEQTYVSLKVFNGSAADQEVICAWMNTGYDASRRVDNQPGMYARSQRLPDNVADVTQVFAGDWDGSGANRNPANPSEYLTAAYDGTYSGTAPVAQSDESFLNVYGSTALDKLWVFRDVPGSGSSRCLIAVWYVNDTLQGICLGKGLYDAEGLAPTNVDGCLLAKWVSEFDSTAGTSGPKNNSCATTTTTPGDGALAVIRQRTNGGVTFPSGTPDGSPLAANCGPVTKSTDRIGASDNVTDANISEVVRQDISFSSLVNDVQGNAFPNPRIAVHREYFGVQSRVGFAQPRMISRWPNGGAFGSGFSSGLGSVDWADSRMRLPWYYACCSGEAEGAVITEGSRQIIIFPGSRNGIDLEASHRAAGIGLRLA